MALHNGASSNTIGGTATGAGNVISGNSNGIYLTDSGTSSNLLQGNFIGTNPAGTSALGNTIDGVVVASGATNNTIGGTATGAGNVISGNTHFGVYLNANSSSGNVVLGNFIGTNAAGTSAIKNHADGLRIEAANSTIGGTVAGAGNIISGNGGNGIRIETGATGTLVVGNLIGTDVNGTASLGNAANGVDLESVSLVTIGGTSSAARNVISANSSGVKATGTSAFNDAILGNYIGTDINGTAALGNRGTGAGYGVWLDDGASNNTVGGSAAGAGNVISGNLVGVQIDNTGGLVPKNNLVAGNFIGTNAAGTAALGNGIGIQIQSASQNTIGGATASSANVISGNSNYAVTVDGSTTTGNVVENNAIGTQNRRRQSDQRQRRAGHHQRRCRAGRRIVHWRCHQSGLAEYGQRADDDQHHRQLHGE